MSETAQTEAGQSEPNETETIQGETNQGGRQPADAAGRRSVRAGVGVGLVATLTAGALLGVGAASAPLPLVVLAALGLLTCLIVRWPAVATYAYLGLFPFIVGLDRAAFVPVLRLNEALLGALWLGVLLGPIRQWAARGFPAVRVLNLDKAMLALAVLSSVTSLTWMYARGVPIGQDDVLYAIVLWKALALYVLVRITVRTPRQVRVAAAVTIAVVGVVAVIGVLQALGVPGVSQALLAFSSDEDPARMLANNRASSTIGGALPFGDLTVMAAALAWGLAHFCDGTVRRILYAATGFLALAALASGQVSSVLGLVVALIGLGLVARRLPQFLGAGVALAVAAYFLLGPVITSRLNQVDQVTGLPTAWTGQNGRLANLQTYVIPQIMDGANWLFGVQASARIPAPETFREWIYIESGYVALVWNGGIPLLIAFVVFLVIGLRTSAVLARLGRDEFRLVGQAGFAALCLIAVLMIIDPHLTYRGTSDLFFPLVAMCATGYARLQGDR